MVEHVVVVVMNGGCAGGCGGSCGGGYGTDYGVNDMSLARAHVITDAPNYGEPCPCGHDDHCVQGRPCRHANGHVDSLVQALRETTIFSTVEL